MQNNLLYKYATCAQCGRDWQISSKTKIGRNGYICPSCAYKKKRRTHNGRIALLILGVGIIAGFAVTRLACSSAAEEATTVQMPRIETVTVTLAPEHKARALVIESEPTATPSPFTDADVQLLAELMTAEAHVVLWNGEQHGVSPYARIAAVGWCVLNRCDKTGATLEEVIKKPHQFAWHDGIEVADGMHWLAADVLERYWAEKQGQTDVGRTLPETYLFFHGDGRENYFREEYKGNGEYWDWKCEDPYSD